MLTSKKNHEIIYPLSEESWTKPNQEDSAMAYMNSNYEYPPAWDEPEEDEYVEDDYDGDEEEYKEDPHSESLWEQRKWVT